MRISHDDMQYKNYSQTAYIVVHILSEFHRDQKRMSHSRKSLRNDQTIFRCILIDFLFRK